MPVGLAHFCLFQGQLQMFNGQSLVMIAWSPVEPSGVITSHSVAFISVMSACAGTAEW